MHLAPTPRYPRARVVPGTCACLAACTFRPHSFHSLDLCRECCDRCGRRSRRLQACSAVASMLVGRRWCQPRVSGTARMTPQCVRTRGVESDTAGRWVKLKGPIHGPLLLGDGCSGHVAAHRPQAVIWSVGSEPTAVPGQYTIWAAATTTAGACKLSGAHQYTTQASLYLVLNMWLKSPRAEEGKSQPPLL